MKLPPLHGSGAGGFPERGMTKMSSVSLAPPRKVVTLELRLSILLSARVICTRSDVLDS